MLPGSIATAVMMPVIGALLKKNYINPAVYAGAGLVLFFIFCYMMGLLNTQVGIHDFFWPLIVRGFAMGLIFIPLTTISLSELQGKEIPQGTALSNMVRQLGGSIGIALITTFISRETVKHYDHLAENITLTDPQTQQRIQMLTNGLRSKGYDSLTAVHDSFAIISRSVSQQATFLTYKDLFVYLGLFFLLMIPFLIMFRNKKKEKASEEQIEWALE